jgi:hypothetical protein
MLPDVSPIALSAHATHAALQKTGQADVIDAALMIDSAEVALDKDMPRDALTFARAAVSAAPTSFSAWEMMVRVAAAQGDDVLERDALDELLRIDPVPHYALRAAALHMAHKPSRARALLHHVLLRCNDAELRDRASTMLATIVGVA